MAGWLNECEVFTDVSLARVGRQVCGRSLLAHLSFPTGVTGTVVELLFASVSLGLVSCFGQNVGASDLNPPGTCVRARGAASVLRATVDAEAERVSTLLWLAGTRPGGLALCLLFLGEEVLLCTCLFGRPVEATLTADGWMERLVWLSLRRMRGRDLLLRDSENMITVQEDRAMFVCSTRIQNGEPSARTSCRARVRPDSA